VPETITSRRSRFELDLANGIAPGGGKRHELATCTRNMNGVGGVIPREPTRLVADEPACGDLAVDQREQRTAAAKRDVDAPGAVFDQATRLVTGGQHDLVGDGVLGEIDRDDAIAIGIRDHGAEAVAGDQQRATGDRCAKRRRDFASLTTCNHQDHQQRRVHTRQGPPPFANGSKGTCGPRSVQRVFRQSSVL